MAKTSSKYKYVTVGIDNLQPGEGIAFHLEKPWGLAAYIYKTYKPKNKDSNVHLRVDKVNKIVYVWRGPDWKKVEVD